MGVREALAGKRVLLTGVTGFVGEAVLERLLADVPDARLVLLVRGKAGSDVRARVEHLLGKPAFRPLRERVGGTEVLRRMLDERVEVLEGDLAHWPALPADLDVVVHCAGEVAFDPAIDEGFATNAGGVRGLLEALHDGGARPHVVHVSTAYVNGARKGEVAEGRLDHDIDWRTEAAAAGRLRISVEDASRTPAALASFRAEAGREHGREGPRAVATDAERRRREWVTERLVAAGRERARSLGFTDCYTFTKAMGERVAEELGASLPVSILRPSIIESALTRPYPGWIEGHKMAEPIILAYGRGELPEFPAVPDGIIDIIPVDLVVGAILAAAAAPPRAGGPAYYHLCSGSRNPLQFHRLYTLVRDYFSADPLPARDRGELAVAEWRFPGADRVGRRLRAGERAVDVADRAVSRLPRSPRVRAGARRLDRQRSKVDFLRRYFDLYEAYTAAEVVYRDDNTQALYDGLTAADQASFACDPAAIDWRHYLVDVHCPSVTALLRTMGKRRRGGHARAHADLPGRTDVAAVFDMDGTLLPSNVVESYLRLRLADLPDRADPPDRADTGVPARARELADLADLARRLPGWLRAESRDRSTFLRAVYRRYEGARLADLEQLVDEELTDSILARVSARALRRVREHRAAGHRTVLLTGAVAPLTRPLAPLFDEVVAARLHVDGSGRATGFLATPPVVGEARASWLRTFAGRHGLELADSYAYADSASDLPLLRAVGRPVAVNPDTTLFRVAQQGRWPVREWRSSGRPARGPAGTVR